MNFPKGVIRVSFFLAWVQERVRDFVYVFRPRAGCFHGGLDGQMGKPRMKFFPTKPFLCRGKKNFSIFYDGSGRVFV